MKSKIVVLLVTLTIFTMGCGNYNSGKMMAGGPNLMQLAPSSIAAGSQQLQLTVNGSGFASNSVVYWAGMAQPTTFVNTTQLMALIPASQVAFPVMVPVYVRSNNLISNTVNFTVN